jgi:DNA primase
MSDPVADLLKEHNVYYIPSGRDYLTKCFNPEHNDSNPSFRIDKSTGIAHCFSCGFKTNIFKFYGVLTNNVSIKIVKLKDKLKALTESVSGLEPIKGAKPFPTKFRGISLATLKYFEAFHTTLDPELEDRLVIPVKDIRDKVTAYVGRHVLSDGNPRYLIRPAHATVGMYPAKLPDHPRNIILVEGMFDLLNMWDKGARNVVCTFGTSKLYNDTADKMLPYKVMGVEKVFILYDGDDAGRTAATKIKPLIEECGFTVEVINLPDGDDPGDLDHEYVESIIEYTR